MNYLAHLHIAEHTGTSFLGNFLGDFVKGDPEGKFNQKVVKGIRLHRFVDSYTDSHSLVRSVKPLFKKELRRFSPIALDMFWDHCLAKHWAVFHGDSLTDFSAQAQIFIANETSELAKPLPVQFDEISQRVWQGNWFEHYREIDNIEFALQRISSRRPRVAPLADTFSTLSDNYQKLSATFFDLYPEVLAAARQETKKETK